MLTIVTGGSGSGKSEYAESLLSDAKGCKYYIATMQVYDDEGRRKVERHRRLRDGKGFWTIEQPRQIGQAGERMPKGDAPACALLECMSNLVANEMFSGGTEDIEKTRDIIDGPDSRSSGELAAKIALEVVALSGSLKELVVVTNNVFEDGGGYDGGTMEYLAVLGEVNRRLCEAADRVIEVVVGIPVVLKKEKGEDKRCQ